MSHQYVRGKVEDRMNAHQADRRQARIQARRTVAEQISREHAITRGVVGQIIGVLQRGFFGRLKWLLFGR